MNLDALIRAALARIHANIEHRLRNANHRIGQRIRRARERRERAWKK